MHQWSPALLALVVAMPLLAGCLSGDQAAVVDPLAITAAALEEDRFYAMQHWGGDLFFTVHDGDAAMTLYDPDDRRLGRLELGTDTFRPDVRLEDVRSGTYVLHIEALNGTLDVLSRDRTVAAFHALPSHLERLALAERPFASDPVSELLGPVGPQQPVDELVPVPLSRTPAFLRVLAAGQGEGIEVIVTGAQGKVLELESATLFGPGFAGPGHTFYNLGGRYFAENVRSGELEAHVSASSLHGVLVLESWSYSRHDPSPAMAPVATQDDIRFTYGRLPEGRPIQVEVHERASWLYMWTGAGPADEEFEGRCDFGPTNQSECDGALENATDAWVAVYGPEDDKLGTYRLLAGTVLKIRVGGGDHVAVAKAGEVWLGTDRVPVDFEMHVLEVAQTVLPEQAAGQSGNYEIRNDTGQVPGVPFGIEPDVAIGDTSRCVIIAGAAVCPTDNPLSPCTDRGTLRIMEGGETIGFWGPQIGEHASHADLYIGPGPIAYVQDGMGGTCGHSAVRVLSFLR